MMGVLWDLFKTPSDAFDKWNNHTDSDTRQLELSTATGDEKWWLKEMGCIESEEDESIW